MKPLETLFYFFLFLAASLMDSVGLFCVFGCFLKWVFFILFLFLYYGSDFFLASSYSKFQNFLSCNVFVGFSE